MNLEWHHIEKMKAACTLPQFKTDSIIERLIYIEDFEGEFIEDEARELVIKLQNNQADPIINAHNYGQNDIIRHLRKLR